VVLDRFPKAGGSPGLLPLRPTSCSFHSRLPTTNPKPAATTTLLTCPLRRSRHDTPRPPCHANPPQRLLLLAPPPRDKIKRARPAACRQKQKRVALAETGRGRSGSCSCC
jgi:hypothetical protein